MITLHRGKPPSLFSCSHVNKGAFRDPICARLWLVFLVFICLFFKNNHSPASKKNPVPMNRERKKPGPVWKEPAKCPTRLKGNKLSHWPPAQCLFPKGSSLPPTPRSQASALRKSDILCLKLIWPSCPSMLLLSVHHPFKSQKWLRRTSGPVSFSFPFLSDDFESWQFVSCLGFPQKLNSDDGNDKVFSVSFYCI